LRRLLTDGFLRATKPPKEGRTEIIDLRCPGLVFRVTAGGVRTWAFRFRDRRTGKQGRAKIGAYPSTGLETARSAASALRRIVDAGGNPTQERRTGGPDSFKALAARYLAAVKDPRSDWYKRSHAADERNLRKHVLAHWGERRFAAITRADVVELTTGLVAAGTPTLANRVQSLVSNIFSFALDGGEIAAHPCFRLRKRGKERVGSRVLTDAEVRLFWRKVIEPAAVMRTGLGLRLTLATGARVTEVALMNRAELEHIAIPDAAVWVIPGERTKNGRDHAIPLSPLARECVLELLAMIEPAEQFLFPTRSTRRKGPMRGNTLTQAMDFFANRLSGDDDAIRTWLAERPTPHDLRRTLATRLAALGIPREIRDRCLNHIGGDVGTKHYNRYEFLAEKRDAFARWSTVLSSILYGTSATVVPLAGRIGGRGNGA
jgi:integrase